MLPEAAAQQAQGANKREMLAGSTPKTLETPGAEGCVSIVSMAGLQGKVALITGGAKGGVL